MPGSRLNDTERRLAGWWGQEGFDSPVLRRVGILGDPGLRGIRDLEVNFSYPLTVFCGRNGSGKTTLLALAALAFGGASRHFPRGALRGPRLGEDFTYYTFRDFFFRGAGDPNLVGITVTWTYAGALRRQDGRPATNPIVVRKRGDKWMHYERRPSKPVDYVGVARSIPAAEQRVLRSHFGATARRFNREPLTAEYRQRLSEIMGRTYDEAEVMSTRRYALRSCDLGGTSYSSFNMGAGEDILIELLHILQEAPRGSLIVIEEVEVGLHSEACVRLAKHLQEIMLAKQLQVVASTHSQHFLDAVPRQARVLIQRDGDVHAAIGGPTARFAAGVMSGQADHEAIVYCEDGFALSLVGAALTPDLRRRCRVAAIGSKSELASQALFHQRGGFGQLFCLIWDGDVSTQEIHDILRRGEARGVDMAQLNYARLPGALPPERWVLGLLDTEEGRLRLSEELQTSPAQAAQLMTELEAVGADPHSIVPELARKAHLRPDEAEHSLIAAARRLEAAPLAQIRAVVEALLRGEVRQDPPRPA